METHHLYSQAHERSQTQVNGIQCGRQRSKATQLGLFSHCFIRLCRWQVYSTVSHPQHHLQPTPPPQVTVPTVMCQIISEKSRNSKARRPPEGALSLPSWSLGSFQQTQRAPKWAFDQWRPGWYWWSDCSFRKSPCTHRYWRLIFTNTGQRGRKEPSRFSFRLLLSPESTEESKV